MMRFKFCVKNKYRRDVWHFDITMLNGIILIIIVHFFSIFVLPNYQSVLALFRGDVPMFLCVLFYQTRGNGHIFNLYLFFNSKHFFN